MDIKLGKLRVNLSALALYDRMADPIVSRFITARQAPRRFYRWDCVSQIGKPAPRPASRGRESSLLIHLPGMLGGADKVGTRELTRDLLKAADVKNLRALDAALQVALPPLVVPVDWAQLLDPFKAAYSIDLYEQVTYLQMLVRPYGLMPEDHLFIFMPHLVTFTARVTGRCGGTAKNGTALTGYSPHIVLKGGQATLERQIGKEEHEAEKRRNRMGRDDLMPLPRWNLKPFHEEDEGD